MEKSEKCEKREYCPDCGEIMVKEMSLYFPKSVNTLCYSCQFWYKNEEYKDETEANQMCIDYWRLVFKVIPVTSAELKINRRMPKVKKVKIINIE